jgi:hypothetical protein
LQAERGEECSLRMILMSDGRSEQRKDTVAGGLHDVAVVAPHRLDHQLERRINDRTRLLGIEVAHQLGRALDVGEQGRHRLALAVDQRRRVWLFQTDTNIGS